MHDSHLSFATLQVLQGLSQAWHVTPTLKNPSGHVCTHVPWYHNKLLLQAHVWPAAGEEPAGQAGKQIEPTE